uniref:F-box domain-containing protein n=1 Tax=Oryza glumipatula TaxID=40148 RepID=A0A0E0BKJ1_9ORYZ
MPYAMSAPDIARMPLVLFRQGTTDSRDTYVVVGLEFPASNRTQSLMARPRLVFYITRSRGSLPSLSNLQDCSFRGGPAQAVHLPRDCTSASIPAQAIDLLRDALLQMEMCSREEIMDLCRQAIHQNMCYVVPRVLPQQLCLPPPSPKDELHSTLTKTSTRKFSDLPHDILMDIIAMLEIPDALRAASVCSSWRSVHTKLHNLGKYKRPQTPCFLYTSQSIGENIACLYSLSEKRTYKLTLPEPPISRRYLLGSSDGWLVTADERSEMHILNPITGEQIALPSVITINQVTPIFNRKGVLCKYRYSRHTAEGVTDSPMTLPLDKLRLGHDKWTWLPPHLRFQDCTYKDGLLYAVTSLGEIFAFDLNTTVITAKIIMDRTKEYSRERIYIVQAPWGDLLQVWRPPQGDGRGYDEITGRSALVSNTGRTKLYRVDTLAKELVEISDLGDHVLFMGNNQTYCLCAKEYPLLKANHIYFTDDSECLALRTLWGFRLDIGLLNLRDKSVEEIVSPRLWLKCCAPVLLVPNPRKMNSTSCLAAHMQPQRLPPFAALALRRRM